MSWLFSVSWITYLTQRLALFFYSLLLTSFLLTNCDILLNLVLTNNCFYFAGIRILVTLLLDTLPMLWNVLAICFFIFAIFGIVAVQLWQGVLRGRCFPPQSVSDGCVGN